MFLKNTKIILVLTLLASVSNVFSQDAATAPAQGDAPKTQVEQTTTENTSPEEIASEETESSAPVEDEMVAEQGFSLIDTFNAGGAFMWPILIMAALGLAFILERLFYFLFFARIGSKEFIDKLGKTITHKRISEVEELCNKKKNRIAEIVNKGLSLKTLGYERVEKAMSVAASVQVAKMEKNLNILAAVANIVPMLGFLGTVTGMIVAFDDIAAQDQISAKVVAGGIKQALLTTAAGLVVAIPVLLTYNYFLHQVEGFIASIEKLASDVVEKLVKGDEGSTSSSTTTAGGGEGNPAPAAPLKES